MPRGCDSLTRKLPAASLRDEGILQRIPLSSSSLKRESCCFDGCAQANVLRVREAASLRLTEATYPARLRLPQHTHQESCFCFLLQGAYDITCGKHVLLRKPGSLTFTTRGEIHSNRIHGQEVRCFAIELTRPWIERVNRRLEFLQGPVQFDNGPMPWLAMRLYREFRQEDDLTPLAIEGLALELLAGAARHTNGVSQNGAASWLTKATGLLHERFQDPLTLGQVAEFAGVHPVSLARAFRKTYRCSVGEYVRKLRVEFACRKLSASHESLLEIAFSAGFSEQSHFCRTFKSLTGLTPSQFRSNSRAG